MRNYNKWTIAELKRASGLWDKGLTAREIAEKLGRDHKQMEQAIYRNRSMFSFRKTKHGQAKKVSIKFCMSSYLHGKIKAQAQERNVSMAMIITEALRDKFIRNEVKPPFPR